MSELDLAIAIAEDAAKIAAFIDRLIKLGGLTPEQTAELQQIQADVESHRGSAEARWKSLGPNAPQI